MNIVKAIKQRHLEFIRLRRARPSKLVLGVAEFNQLRTHHPKAVVIDVSTEEDRLIILGIDGDLQEGAGIIFSL